eukprot:TRINITY_DN7830_c0_g1_i1.p1 TRINITY_DN7830_c0_g1~~TRINITY_DN7830_c0_g1_i1.p1  ORF type:complete len:241 (-),score=30.25 TRINITY_DN7830_c0_g1_i1:363-1025(-)
MVLSTTPYKACSQRSKRPHAQEPTQVLLGTSPLSDAPKVGYELPVRSGFVPESQCDYRSACKTVKLPAKQGNAFAQSRVVAQSGRFEEVRAGFRIRNRKLHPYAGVNCTVCMFGKGVGRALVALPSARLGQLGVEVLRQRSGTDEAVIDINGISVTIEKHVKADTWTLHWSDMSERCTALAADAIACTLDQFIDLLYSIELSHAAPDGDQVPMSHLCFLV